MGIIGYKINKLTLMVDVSNTVNLIDKGLTYLPIRFGKISGGFNISHNLNLCSLHGCPHTATDIILESTNISDFVGIGNSIRLIVGSNLNELRSFNGIPTEMNDFFIDGSCEKVQTLEHFPTKINGTLYVGDDFKWLNILHKHVINIDNICLFGDIDKYKNILNILYVGGIRRITFDTDCRASEILTREIERQPDPRKRNLLRVAQELSNAGFHHLTV